MIIYYKLDNYFVVSADRQTYLGFAITANSRDTFPLKGALQTELAFQIKGDSVEIFRGSISSVRLRKLMNLTS